MFPTLLLVLPSGQALMQAPEESVPSASVYPPEPSAESSSTAQPPHYQWLNSQLNSDWIDSDALPQDASGQISNDQNSSGQSAYRQPVQKSYWQWQHIGGALTGTAMVSAGLAAPYTGEQSISIPVGEAYLSPHKTGLVNHSAHSGQFAQEVAFNQGQAIRPSVSAIANRNGNPAQQALFSRSTPANAQTNAQQPTGQAATLTDKPQLIRNENGGWSLTYNAPAEETTGPLNTQAVINQLVTQNRSQPTCLDRACRGLDYIQTRLPAAEQTLQNIQQQITDFETKYGQSDLKAYQKVLSERIAEITIQQTQIAVDLADTNRYIGQLKVRLTTINVAPDLAKNLLAADADYQTQWLSLQRSERQLLEEFSKANVDATALNQIYTQYEQQQIELYQSAQAVLGNYLLANEGQEASPVYIEPAALELLQSLIVAIHQKDIQQLRDRTIQQAQGNLQGRHRELAQNITRYESLQDELVSATAIVNQYKQERDRITATTSAATLAARSNAPTVSTTTAANSTSQPSPAFAVAESLESQLAEGSIGKTLIAIVIAAGAMAVAAQRRAGDVSAALSLEISPSPQPKPFGLQAIQKRISNPIQPDLLAELIEITQPARPALAAQGAPFGLLAPAADPVTHTKPAALATQSDLEQESMTRELQAVVTQSEPEARFAKEVEQRNIDPVRLTLDEIDAFAESAVRWVLKDLSNHRRPVPCQEDEPMQESDTVVKRETVNA